MKQKTVKETVSKGFLLSLLEPFHPTLKPNEKIVNLNFKNEFNTIEITYTIAEGGVKDST